MSEPGAKFTTPRIAAGALFVNGDRILLVHKTYGNGWDIPGGYVDTGESPAAACRRELKEELGIEREAQRLLIVDWAPHVDEGDKILFIFDCGDLGDDEQHIQPASDELDRWAWVPVEQLPGYIISRLARRLANAYQAHTAGIPLYLEHGRPALEPRRAGTVLMSEPEPAPVPHPPARRPQRPGGWRVRDGRKWRIGTDVEVAWIAAGTDYHSGLPTSMSRTITGAIPAVFEAYVTVPVPYGAQGRDVHDRALLTLLGEQSPDQRWWLGYLDTGVDDIVFPDAPKVTLYAGWHYVLIEAGADQAANWRPSDGRAFGTGDLPNLMFPADRSWLVSTLWDDDWTCIGGTAKLVDRFLRHPDLQARSVALGQDVTPPGHQAI